jgi:hypothetical protein
VILAEDLERLVIRRASLVDEIVDTLLPGYQFFPLLRPPQKNPGQFTLPGLYRLLPQLVGYYDPDGEVSFSMALSPDRTGARASNRGNVVILVLHPV